MARIMLSKRLKELYSDKSNHPCYGRKVPEDTRKKISASNKVAYSDPTRNPMYGKYGENNPNYGQKRSDEFREKCRVRSINRMAVTDYSGEKNPRSKPVVRLSDMKRYAYAKEAAADNDIPYSTFKSKCRKKDGFAYCEDIV